MKTGTFLVKASLLKIFFLILFLSPGFTFAQVLGKYEFTGVTTLQTQDSLSKVTAQPPYAVFSDFRRHVVQWWRGDNIYNSREWGKDSTELRYIEFTVTAKPGHRLNLTKLVYSTSRTATGPALARITHNASGSFSSNFKRYAVSESNQTIEWDFEDIISPASGSVTFRIYGWNSSSYLGAMRVDNVTLYGNTIPEVRVNEFHYANTFSSKTGFVEVALPKDFTEVNTITVSLYNGSGTVYGSYNLSLFKSVDNGLFNDERILYLDVPTGLAAEQGGISISAGAHVIQFVSYGGIINAVSGPAAGLRSQDVVVTELGSDGASSSVFLTVANDTRFLAGIWSKGIYNSKGYPNTESYSVLPVELLFFQAQTNTKEVTLVWATATEKENDKFILERSRQDATNFEAISTIKGAGTTHTKQQYKFIDTKPVAGISYYRLKQIDLDGKVNYSPIVAVNRPLAERVVNIYPNPATSLLNIDLGETKQVKNLQLKIVNATGKAVLQINSASALTQQAYAIPVADLPTGTYFLVLLKDGKSETRRFVKL